MKHINDSIVKMSNEDFDTMLRERDQNAIVCIVDENSETYLLISRDMDDDRDVVEDYEMAHFLSAYIRCDEAFFHLAHCDNLKDAFAALNVQLNEDYGSHMIE